MLHRLSAVLIVVMFAFGLFAGLGPAYAVASPLPCHAMTADNPVADHSTPAKTCDGGAVHSACLVHVSCVAFIAPAPATVHGHVRAAGWQPAPLAGPSGASLLPETPPPIASL